MKTLDELIQALEICTTHMRCVGVCPYHKDGCTDYRMEKDALYYLKEYQRYQNTPSRMVHMAVCDEAERENEPLTWEEMQNMEGNPVWITHFGWDVIDGVGNDSLNTAYGITYKRDDMGTEWQAYRKER